VLLLYGDFESGSVVREQDVREFQRMVPHAVVRKVPGGSHGLWWEQPETTRRLVKEFLNSI
jgi:pimeloyl-ACP methyl ester carboxylesterase